MGLECRCDQEHLVWRIPLAGRHGDDLRTSFGERAGFVDRHAVDERRGLQELSAFDNHAASRGGVHAADNRHRCRDHQRARTGDHQHHQRAAKPGEKLRPPPARIVAQRSGQHQQRRPQRHRDRQCEHRRRVISGESIDKSFGRRAGRLGLLDQPGDVRQRAFGSRPLGPHHQRAFLVERAGKHRLAGAFLDRKALAGDRRLVERRGAAQHHAVDRHALAGLDQHALARRDAARRDVDVIVARCVVLQAMGHLGCQLDQRLHGATGAADAEALQPYRDAEQKHCRGGLEVIRRGGCPHRSDQHQHVHVDRPQPHRAPGGQRDGQSGKASREHRQRGGQRRRLAAGPINHGRRPQQGSAHGR